MQRGRNQSSTFNIIFLILYFIHILVGSKKVDGFSTKLIHVNSPLSPFFNPNLTDQGYTEQIGSSHLIHDVSFYLMKISYGTPPVELYQAIDTGSDLSWIQCLPCENCYSSKLAAFNPNTSSTFKFENCSTPNERCRYEIEYEDKSHSYGDLARETITIGTDSQKEEFKNFLFGCGHDNGNGYFPRKGAGMLGLNRQERSFITQLHTEHHGLFSYCLAPPDSRYAGKISFGEEARVSGNNVMRTQLIRDFDYAIMLTKITIKRKRSKYFPDSYLSSNDSKLNNVEVPLIVDSGAKLTYLPDHLYSYVEKEIKKKIRGKTPVRPLGGYRLCYSSSLMDTDIPKVKFHFSGGILKLRPLNVFVPVRGRHCLAILPTNQTSVLGHIAQMNFLVGFDLVDKKLSFKPTHCATW